DLQVRVILRQRRIQRLAQVPFAVVDGHPDAHQRGQRIGRHGLRVSRVRSSITYHKQTWARAGLICAVRKSDAGRDGWRSERTRSETSVRLFAVETSGRR